MAPDTGWLPVTIGFDARAAMLPDAAVRWLEFGDAKPAAPFLEYDVARLRLSAREAETDLATLIRAGSRLPETAPAGFIFDFARCGSLAVANALRVSDAVVMSEPQPVASLLLPQSDRVAGYQRARWEQSSRSALRAIFSFYAHYRTGEAERVVVKFPSVSVLSLKTVRAWWPGVPCLIVARDPVEVIHLNLEGRGWINWQASPRWAREILGWRETEGQIEAMPKEEFSARVVARFMEAAIAGMDEGCVLLDHEDLNETRMREAAARFGLRLPEGDAVRRALCGGILGPDGRRTHYDDREVTRRTAGAAVRDAAQRWAMARYFDLRAR